MLHGRPYGRVLWCLSPSAIVHCWGGIEVSYDNGGAYHGQWPVRLHEMLEERVRGVAEWDMYVDDVQLPGWTNKFICRQAALNA